MVAKVKITNGIVEVNVNLKKTGSDPDVINAWVQDEFENKLKIELGVNDFTVLNMDELIAEAKKLEDVI